MIDETTTQLESFRFKHPVFGIGIIGQPTGYFRIPTGKDEFLHIISSQSFEGICDWEHVSVHVSKQTNLRAERTPTYYEMDRVKKMFWKDNETVMQLHVPVSNHINVHEHTLHLWRPVKVDIPLPPSRLV